MIVYKCDCCGAELPIVKKKNFLGEEVEVVERGLLDCKEYDFSTINKLNPNALMCPNCAKYLSAKIDYELLKVKSEAYKESETK